MEVYILGTKYTIVDIPDNDEYDGICDTSIKQIKIAEFKDDGSWRSKGNLDYARKKTLRHEIVHAFLYESGMDTDSLQDDEQIVDWFAIQSPKLLEAFIDANAI